MVEDPSDYFIEVPHVRLKLRANTENFETEADIHFNGKVIFPKFLLTALRLAPENLLAITVRDRGMEPLLFEDDTVVFDTSDRRAVSGEVYALNIDGEPCITQILNNGGQWYLRPLNSSYKTINMRSVQCIVVGRVIYQLGRQIAGRL